MNTQGLAGSVEDRIAQITAFNQRYWRLPRPLARILNPQNEINKLLLDLAEAMSARAADSVEREQRALAEIQRASDRYFARFDEAEAVLRGLTEGVLRDREATTAHNAGVESQLSALVAGLERVRADIRSEIRAAQQRSDKNNEMLQQQAAAIMARLNGLESKVASQEGSQLKAEIELKKTSEGVQGLKGNIEALKKAAEGSAQAINGNIEAMRAGNKAQAKLAEARYAELGQLLTETIAQVDAADAAQEEIKAELARELEKRPVGFSDEKFYLAFENRFRGSREEVISKLNDYVPTIMDPEVRPIAGPVLDLGCGRGEWLEVIRASGIEAYGVDISPAMVEECLRRGLTGVVNDALDHLRSLQSSSLKGITSFHLVEHLGLKALQEILAESFRTLKPGGVLVLETPNPQNLLVGACNFYMDPTHKNPIPPMTLAFLVEYAGFSEVRVLPRNPFPPENHFPLPRSATEEALNSFFFGARDYAVIARRPATEAGSSSDSSSSR